MRIYAWVCKYIKFPVVHPTIHLECGDIPTKLAKEKLLRCTVLHSRDLCHPMLHIGAVVACYSVSGGRAGHRSLMSSAVTRKARTEL